MRTRINLTIHPNNILGRIFNFKYALLFVLAGFLLVTSSCTKKSDNSTMANVVFQATLSGASETPANASAGMGNATLTYNPNTMTFTVMVTYSGVTATAAHIHNGALGVSGSVVFPLNTTITSPISYTSIALTTSQQADLYANLYYVNIHSAAFAGGEIRGQLIKQP
jgi:hypothetical protein